MLRQSSSVKHLQNQRLRFASLALTEDVCVYNVARNTLLVTVLICLYLATQHFLLLPDVISDSFAHSVLIAKAINEDLRDKESQV